MRVPWSLVPVTWLAAWLAAAATAQTLEERLDEDRFLRGLTELQLPELLEHYMQTHAPQDAADAAVHLMAVERMAMSRPGATAAERRRRAERILELRGELIETQESNPQRPVWMADQAAELFYTLLPLNGAGLNTLFGLASEEQRAVARRVAGEMDRLTAAAEVAVARAILALEADPRLRESLALQRRHRRLIEEERDRRIPFLRGIAAALHGELVASSAARRRESFELAADLLAPVAERMTAPPAATARLYAALALARLGDRERARALLAAVADDGQADPADVFAARSAELALAAEEWGPQAALDRLSGVKAEYGGNDELFYRVLLADQEFLLRRRIAAQAGPERRARLADAYRVYVDLLEAETAAEPAVVRGIVFERLAAVTGEDTPLDALPPLVTLVRAETLSRDAATAGNATELYRRVLERSDLAGADRALALFGLGRALHAQGDVGAAIERFTAVAEDHPQAPEAERAIQVAAALGAQLYEQAPRDPRVRELLGDALDVLLRRYVNLPSADRWRYLAGRMAFDDQRYEQALELFGSIARDADEWVDARFMMVSAVRSRARTAASAGPERWEELIERSAAARGLLEDVAAREDDAERLERVRYYIGYLKVFEAEGHLSSGRPDKAIEVLADIEAGGPPDGVVMAAALQTRIDAHQALGHRDDAHREVARFAQEAPGQVGQVLPPMMLAVQHDVEALRDQGRPDAARAMAVEELAPLARILAAWVESAPPGAPDLELARLRAADGLRLSGAFADALPLYDGLLARSPSAMQYLLGRAECLYHLGGDGLGDAMGIYKRLAALGAERGGSAYWLAQLRMLQILDQVGRHTDKISPRIERLRREDPGLGGERFRRQLDALQSKHR